MKKIMVTSFAFFLVCMGFFSAQAGETPQFGPWFDGDGAFHSESPLDYMNKVNEGKINDQVIREAIKKAFPESTVLTLDQVRKIALNINAAKVNAAFYFKPLAGNPSVRNLLETNQKTGKTGFIKLAGYGLDTQGGIQKLGGSTVNIAAIFPADPLFLDILNTEGKIDQDKIQTAVEFANVDPFWSAFSSRTAVDLMGVAYFDRLVPGPYLIWVNQCNILRYLYRVEVEPEKKLEVKLVKTLALRFLSIDLPDDKKSTEKKK